MIKRDHSIVAVADYLSEEMDIDDQSISRMCGVLVESQNFTMPTQALLDFVDDRIVGGRDTTVNIELPFQSVYIEYSTAEVFEDDLDRIGLFFVGTENDPDASASMFLTIIYKDGTVLCPAAAAVHCSAPVVQVASKRVPADQVEFVTSNAKFFVLSTAKVLEGIVDGGMRQYEPMTLRRQKKRRKGRKAHKLLEYKMLKVNLDRSAQAEGHGGTHASPRLHLRRGHWRNYKSGERRWIKPMWVGDKNLGVIHKDYEVVV